jgi:hypothetical protein
MTWFDKFLFIEIAGSDVRRDSDLKRAKWNLKFALSPQRCVQTKELIWFTSAYRGVLNIAGSGDSVTLTYWLTKPEFIIKSLKGELNGN